MADTIYTSQTPVVQNDFDGSSHAWGMRFTVASDCSLTGGRAWVPTAGRPTTFLWQVWRVGDATKIAESDLRAVGHGTPSNGAWMSFDGSLFTTPGDVALSSAQSYRVCVAFSGGDGAYTDDGSETFPVGSGGLVSASTGSFTNGGGTNVMPGTDYLAYFWADVDAETAGTEHTKSLASSITPASTLVRSTGRALASSTTVSGTVNKQTSRLLASSVAPTGSLVRSVGKVLTSAITPAGVIVGRAITRALSGSVSPAAAALKALSRLLGGSITASGSVSDAPAVPPAPMNLTAGRPHGRWHTGQPAGRWHIGRPRGD